jgi:hypothetical protein
MIDDPYLFLFLSGFLTDVEFQRLTSTCRMFKNDPLIVTELKRRLGKSTSFVLNTCTRKLVLDALTFGNSRDGMWISARPPSDVSVPIDDLTDSTDGFLDMLSVTITTPRICFCWNGTLHPDLVLLARRKGGVVARVASSYVASVEFVFEDAVIAANAVGVPNDVGATNATLTEIRFRAMNRAKDVHRVALFVAQMTGIGALSGVLFMTMCLLLDDCIWGESENTRFGGKVCSVDARRCLYIGVVTMTLVASVSDQVALLLNSIRIRSPKINIVP